MGGNDADSTADGRRGDDSRRAFLRALGAAGAVAGVGGLAGARETTEGTTEPGAAQGGATTAGGETTTVVLGARTAGWRGLAPAAIADERNPTLRLRAGERYRLVWINLDGAEHEWLLEDGEGTVVERTESAARVGATRAVAFEATDSAAAYRCEYHPERMVGDVEPGEGFETTAGETAGGETTAEETTGETTAAGTTDGDVVEVAIGPEGDYLRFVPERVEVSVGDAVRWTAESEGHNVSAKPEAATRVSLPEGAEPFATYEGSRSFMVMQVGETYEHAFTVPGTYVYVCVPHADQGMVGEVVVSE